MITREELLDTAPEGVDYVYVEKSTCPHQVIVHYHRPALQKVIDKWGGWWTWENRETILDTDDCWDILSCGSSPSDELPRRWAAQREPLEKWIASLGLWNEYHVAWNQEFNPNPNYAQFEETPEQLEKTPEFALSFLKSKLQPTPCTDLWSPGLWAKLSTDDSSFGEITSVDLEEKTVTMRSSFCTNGCPLEETTQVWLCKDSQWRCEKCYDKEIDFSGNVVSGRGLELRKETEERLTEIIANVQPKGFDKPPFLNKIEADYISDVRKYCYECHSIFTTKSTDDRALCINCFMAHGDPLSTELKECIVYKNSCECGATKLKLAGHSSWCPAHDA